MTPNRLTVITPSYNQARFIRRTLESVLSQDVPGLRTRVRRGSTDGTAELRADARGGDGGDQARCFQVVNKGWRRLRVKYRLVELR